MCGRCRNDGQSDAGADHPACGIEAAEAHTQLEGLSGLNGALRKVLLEGVCRSQADKVLVEQGSKGQASLIRERVVSWHDENEPVGRELVGLQGFEIDDIRSDSDFDETFGYGPDDFVTRALLEINVDAGVIGKECPEGLREEFADRGCVCLHSDAAFQSTRIFEQFAFHVLDVLEHEAGMMHEGPASGSEDDASPAAFEQRDAGEFFHLANAPARGSERHVGHLCSMRDARRFCDVEKELQIDQVEAHSRCLLLPSDLPKAG
jgi:hypothetical protein